MYKHSARRVLLGIMVLGLGCSDSNDSSGTQDSPCVQSCLEKGADEAICRSYCDGDGDGKEDNKTDGKDGWEEASLLPTATLTVNGEERRYRIYVPDPVPTQAMPVLVNIHGGDGAEEAYPQETRFVELAQAQGFIAVFPVSDLQPDDEGEWQLNTVSDDRRDIEFISRLLDALAGEYDLDLSRIYATGYSLGSMFTYELVCHLSGRFAAVASFAGSMPVMPSECESPQPVAIMHIHGTDDDTIAYGTPWEWKRWESVGTMWDVPGLVDFWRTEFACQDSTENESADGSSSHLVYAECLGDVRVEHHRLNGGGHEWPESIDGVPTHELMWGFLSQFRRL